MKSHYCKPASLSYPKLFQVSRPRTASSGYVMHADKSTRLRYEPFTVLRYEWFNDFGPAVGIPSFPVETDSTELRQEVVIDCYRQLIKECGARDVLALTGGLKAFMTHAELAWKPIEDIIPPNTECPDLGIIVSGFKKLEKHRSNQQSTTSPGSTVWATQLSGDTPQKS